RKNAEGSDSFNVVQGGTASFEIQVTNTGDVDLTNVVVSDPNAPDCAATFASIPVGGSETYTCQVTNVQAGFTNTASVNTDQGVSDSDDSTVNLLPQGDGVGTPGYWKNHPEVWYDLGDVLIGDWNENGACDAWESCIKLTNEQALYLLDSSNYNDGKDKRYTLARSLVAAWLNVSVANNDFVCIEDAINDAIAFFDEYGLPGEGKPVKGKVWSKDGEPIYLALDYYNNTGGGCAIDRDSGTG
nr:hypothetical protein [Anaerolineae bacterium]